MNYKIEKNTMGIEVGVVSSEGLHIPFAPDNGDYQQYLKWLAEGNTPEPADE